MSARWVGSERPLSAGDVVAAGVMFVLLWVFGQVLIGEPAIPADTPVHYQHPEAVGP